MSFNTSYIREKFLTENHQNNIQVLTLSEKNTESRRAAVLLPIVLPSASKRRLRADDAGALSMLFTRRSFDLKYHAGQISFPGGKVDAADKTIADTALRETFEEIGVASSYVEVIGTLDNFRTNSYFDVTPVVGFVDQGFTLLAQPEEVEEVFTVPFMYLMDQNNHRWHSPEERLPNGKPAESPWLSIDYENAGQEYRIWGATAAMTLMLYAFLNSSN